MSLQDKVVVVTGGSRGIGRAIVEMFTEKGARVFFTYAEQTKAALEVERTGAHGYRTDIRDPKRSAEIVEQIIKEVGCVDILVNNAGIRRDKTLLFMEYADWCEVLEVNLTSLFCITKLVIPHMLKKKSGRIINISSISGISGIPGQVNYSASKAGMIGFTKSLAKEVSLYGIQVNAIAPGAVETDMVKGLPEKVVEKLIAAVPIKRMCTKQEVSMVTAFLADRECSPDYLTGQVIVLDGGMGL